MSALHGSLIKSYSSAEFVTQSIGFNFTKMLSIIKLFTFIPTDINLIKKVLSSFNNIYVDSQNIIYCLPNIGVHTLKGNKYSIILTTIDTNQLANALINISHKGSVLGIVLIFTDY